MEHSVEMQKALARIDHEFSAHAVHDGLKRRVGRAIRLGAEHPEVRARYRARAAQVRSAPLVHAIHIIEHMYRRERKGFQLASSFSRPPRLSLMVLAELRLLLRFMRANGYDRQFSGICAEVLS